MHPSALAPHLAAHPALSLAARSPEIANQLHPRWNQGLTPDQVHAQANRRLWWLCPVAPDHAWQTTPNKRIRKRGGCPFCASKKLSQTNSLSLMFPDIAKQWHSEKNSRKVEEIVAGSNKCYWWRCPAASDHVWRASPGRRTRTGTGCPFCVGRKASSTNSLAALYPDIAAQWDEEKNGPTTPSQVTARSGRRFHWKCPVAPDHRWTTTVFARTQRSAGCLCCCGRQLSSTNSLEARFPEIAKEWDVVLNGGTTAGQIIAGSKSRHWWRCALSSEHVWKIRVGARTSGKSGCPRCQPKKQSARLAANLASGRIFQSKLESVIARALLEPLGYRRQTVARETHCFDFGDEGRNAVIEINGCRYHAHRPFNPGCPGRVVSPLSGKQTLFEKDERIRLIARRHGLRLLELWECEVKSWPLQIEAFERNLVQRKNLAEQEGPISQQTGESPKCLV